jgi:hypothetical protein
MKAKICRRWLLNGRFESYFSELAALEAILGNLPKEQIEFRMADNKWSIAEIVAHLADAEIQAYTRFRSILADDVPYISNHNEAKWTLAFHHASIDVRDSLSVLKLIRNLNYRLIKSLQDSQLKMSGLHSTRGWLTVEDLINGHIVHLRNHMSQVKHNLVEFEKRMR